MLRDVPEHDLWLDGRAMPCSPYMAGSSAFYDLKQNPVARCLSPFDTLFFYFPRQIFDLVADQAEASHVGDLDYAPGESVADAVIHGLARALLPALDRPGTPEIYFGGAHPSPQDRAQAPREGLADYTLRQAPSPKLHTYALDGSWERDIEPLILRSERGAMRLRFAASKMHLVAPAPVPTLVQFTIDGQPPAIIEISRPTLCTLFDGDAPGEHRLDITVAAPGLTLFSATFG